MPSKDTKIISIRVPNRIEFEDISLAKLIVNIYELRKCGAIEIVGNEIVLPEIENGLNMDGFYEVCHEKNIEPQKALDKCVQMLWR